MFAPPRRATAPIRPTRQRADDQSGALVLLLCQEAGVSRAPAHRPLQQLRVSRHARPRDQRANLLLVTTRSTSRVATGAHTPARCQAGARDRIGTCERPGRSVSLERVLCAVGDVAHLVLDRAARLVDLALALKVLIARQVACGLLDVALRLVSCAVTHAVAPISVSRPGSVFPLRPVSSRP